MDLSDYWSGWRTRAANAPSHRVAAVLLAEASHLRHELDTRGAPARLLDRLGISVQEVSGFGSPGASASGPAGSRVWLRKEDDVRRRRFTVCHELAHLLLKAADWEAALPVPALERLCDDFASALLVDPAELKKRVRGRFDWTPSAVLSLCKERRTSLTPVVIALQRAVPDSGVAVVMTSLRPNPRTGDDRAYRVDAAAAGKLFIPRNRRLSSVGLLALANWCDGPARGEASGEDVEVHLAMRRRTIGESAEATGPVEWRATRLTQGVLVVLDTSRLTRHPVLPKSGRAHKRR